MAGATYYIQSCPICGRRLQIRVEYLGKQVSCRHCGGQFVAADSPMRRADSGQPTSDLLQRAEQLLNALTAQKPRGR
jgi:hypothetical protein